MHDTHTGDTALVSVDSAGTQGNQFSYDTSISGDGRYVAFESEATNLVTPTVGGQRDIYVRSLGDPALVITKEAAPDPAWAGEPLTYTLTVSETGGLFGATGMVVSDTVPPNTTCCLTISHGGFQTGGDVLWVGQTINPGQSINLTLVVTVSQVPSGTVVTNQAYRAVISTTKGVIGATGSPVSTTVRTGPLAVHLPLILKSQ